jgi:hypothetical protein
MARVSLHWKDDQPNNLYSISDNWASLYVSKKNPSTGAVKTAAAAFKLRRKCLLTRWENPQNPNPHPYIVAFPLLKWELGRGPSALVWGRVRGFFEPKLKFTPTGLELSTWEVPRPTDLASFGASVYVSQLLFICCMYFQHFWKKHSLELYILGGYIVNNKCEKNSFLGTLL